MELIESSADGVFTAKCPVCGYKYSADVHNNEDIALARIQVNRHIIKYHE